MNRPRLVLLRGKLDTSLAPRCRLPLKEKDTLGVSGDTGESSGVLSSDMELVLGVGRKEKKLREGLAGVDAGGTLAKRFG